MTTPVSIIIPAHNEVKVISATINELLPGIVDNSIELIVVCNGCTDDTERVVRGINPAITCLVTPEPSKAKALNIGDKHASYFPRIYQDADVIISMDAVRKLASTLRCGILFAASPKNENGTITCFMGGKKLLSYLARPRLC